MSSVAGISGTVRRGRDAILVVAGAGAAAWLLVAFISPIQDAEFMLEDLRLAYRPAVAAVRDDIVVLTITEETLEPLPFRSPIPRGFLATSLEKVIARRPRAIGVDLIFDRATTPAEDKRLRETLLESDVPVVVATGDDRSLTPAQHAFQQRYLAGAHAGASNLAETDGVVRHVYLGSASRPSFVHSLASLIGTHLPAGTSTLIRFDYPPLTEELTFPIAQFPLHLVDLLPAAWIEDRVVFIGGDLSAADRHRTPYSIRGGEHRDTPGVILHALALAQLIDQRSPPAPGALVQGMLILAAAAAGLAIYRLRVLGATLLAAVYLGVAFWGPVSRLGLPLLPPLLAFALAGGSTALLFGRTARRERAFLDNAFGHFVSPQIIESLKAAPERLELGGESRDMSFLFTDLAGFTSLTERLPAAIIVDLLQRYLGGLVDVALEHGATIDSFVGDGIHVFFGAPADQPDHAARAVHCALAMDRFAETFRAQEAQESCELGVTRIGVHTGRAIVGNVGGERLFSYTAHGDVVNTTARLEAANTVLRTRICLSADVAAGAADVDCRPVGTLLLRGKQHAIDVVTPCTDIDAAHRADYTEAYEMLKRGDDCALARFTTLCERHPDDTLAAFHAERLAAGAGGTLIHVGGKT